MVSRLCWKLMWSSAAPAARPRPRFPRGSLLAPFSEKQKPRGRIEIRPHFFKISGNPQASKPPKTTNMTPKGTQNHPKSSQRARKQFLEVPRGAEVEKVSQKATKGYQKELIWEPLGLLFGTLFQKNRGLEAASNFDLIFHAFRQPGAPNRSPKSTPKSRKTDSEPFFWALKKR